MQVLITLSVAMMAGLMLSRLTKLLQLPAVTAYIIAGILVGPFCLGRLGLPGLGFVSAQDVESYAIISETALGFIAFSMGNEFRLQELKKNGKAVTVIAVLQALAATALVVGALYVVHLMMPQALPISAVLTLGAIATATAPAATLMVIKQYKAKGPLTKLLLPIVALDDVVGLMVFAVLFGIAKAVEHGEIDPISIIANPLIEVAASLMLGAAVGFLFHFTEQFFHSRSKRMCISITYVFLAVALSMLEFDIGPVKVGFSSLLVCMALGTVFCNMCDFSEELMEHVDRWTSPLMLLFFVISGAGLDFSVFGNVAIIIAGLVYILARSVGKIGGASISAKLTGCSPTVQKYLGITLLPQAGVCLGMSLTAMSLGESGVIIRNIALFAVLIYELVGPMLTRIALQRAGEITEKPTPARLAAKQKKQA